jgi:hypothetical protein
MKNNRIEAISYSEPGEGEFIVCVLDPSIDGKEYVKSMNDSVEEYNKDVESFEEKLREFKQIYKANLSFEQVTGVEMLNEREPKYPPTTPLGFKNVQTAFPEITLERERRKTVNKENREVYITFLNEANENVKKEIEPFKQALITKWPKFKAWAASDWSRTIWYKFELTTFKYVSE